MYWKRAEVNFTNSATFLYLGHDENTILKQEKSCLKANWLIGSVEILVNAAVTRYVC